MSARDAKLRTLDYRRVRGAVMIVCALAIAGMIAGSIADNNRVALAFGLVAAAAALCLLTVTAVAPPDRASALDETVAAEVEADIARLVAEGADEATLRDLLRKVMRARR
jgi:hypothetical protein